MDSSLIFFKASAFANYIPILYTENSISGKGSSPKEVTTSTVCMQCVLQWSCHIFQEHFQWFVSEISEDRCKLISCYFCLLAFWKSLCPLSVSVPYFDHNIILLKKVKCRCISLSKFSIWVKIFQIFLIHCVFSLNKMEVSNIDQTKIQILFVHFETHGVACHLVLFYYVEASIFS